MEGVHAATMTGNRWSAEDSVGASPAYFSFRFSSSKSELSVLGACGRLLAWADMGSGVAAVRAVVVVVEDGVGVVRSRRSDDDDVGWQPEGGFSLL